MSDRVLDARCAELKDGHVSYEVMWQCSVFFGPASKEECEKYVEANKGRFLGVPFIRVAAEIADYSEDIAAAWGLVEHMRTLGKTLLMMAHGNQVIASFYKGPNDKEAATGEGDSAPLAIASAFIRVMEIRKGGA